MRATRSSHSSTEVPGRRRRLNRVWWMPSGSDLAEIPGISVLMSQPIQERVDELISGIRTECAMKLFGDDLDRALAEG